MMSKADHIAYWLAEADSNWIDAQDFARIGKNIWALFLAHLTMEKLSKAIWVLRNSGNTPPRTHNITKLLEGAAFELSDQQVELAAQLNDFQLETRYPNYQRTLQARATNAFTTSILTETAAFRQCLRAMLP